MIDPHSWRGVKTSVSGRITPRLGCVSVEKVVVGRDIVGVGDWIGVEYRVVLAKTKAKSD
jgi:hypothetical protein